VKGQCENRHGRIAPAWYCTSFDCSCFQLVSANFLRDLESRVENNSL